jgi:PAS domain S-box-containing protein
MPRLPLRLILIASFVIPMVGAVGLTGYLSFRNGQRTVEDLAQQLMEEVSDRIQLQLHHYLSNAQIINHLNANAIRSGRLNPQNPDALIQQFWQQRFLFDEVCGTAMYFGNPQGEFTGLGWHRPSQTWRVGRSGQTTNGRYYSYATNAQGQPTQRLETGNLFDPRQRPWYQATRQAGAATWSEVYPDVSQQDLKIALSQPIYDAAGNLQGVVGVDCLFSNIGRLLKQTPVGQSGVIYIMERSGALIASSTDQSPLNSQLLRINALDLHHPLIQQATQLLQQQPDALSKINQTGQFKFDQGGQSYFVQVSPFIGETGLEWLIVVVVPESDFMARIHANTDVTIGLSIAALGVAIAIGVVMARWVTRPIIQISAASHRIVNGELEQPIQVSGIYEVKILAEAFNAMSQEIYMFRRHLEAYARLLEASVFERTQELEREIQERKQIESELLYSQSTLAKAQRVAHVGSWELDTITYQVTWSEESFRIFGLDPMTAEATYTKFYTLIHPNDRAAVQHCVDQTIATGHPYQTEFRILSLDGSIRYVEARGEAIRNAQGQVIRLIGTNLDITDRKQAEQDLQQRSQQDHLLSSVARAFLNQDTEVALAYTLQKLAEFTESDHCYIHKYDESLQAWSTTHEWCKAGISPLKPTFQRIPIQRFLWAWQQVLDGQVVDVRSPADLPPEAASEKQILEQLNIQSFMLVPIIYNRQVYGLIGLNQVFEQKAWNPDHVQLIQVIAELIMIAQIREQAELALQEREVMLRSIGDNLNNGAIYQQIRGLDGRDRFTYISAGIEQIAEVQPAAILENASILHRQIVPADLPKLAAATEQSQRDLSVFNLQLRQLTPSGKLKWLHCRSTPQRLANGETVWSGILLDITDLKQAEEALRSSEIQYRDLVQTANSIILRWDTEGRIKFLNRYGQQFFGLQEDEILGRHVVGTIVPATETSGRDLQALMVDICSNPAGYQDNENENVRSNGQTVWVKWTNKAIVNEQGELLEVLSVGFDITERKRAEEALFDSELMFRSIIENVNDVIYILNPDGTFSYLSPSLIPALGYDPDELVGTHFAPLIHPDYLQLCIDAVQGLVETGQTIWGLEYLITSKQGKWHWYISNIAAVHDDAGNVLYCVGVARDVTQQKAIEVELRQAKVAADAASKAKSEFLANMSHELRSPLNVILGFAQLLQRSHTLNADQQENVEIILRSGEHLLTLINNVLDLSKIEAGRTTLNETDFNLHRLLDDVEMMFRLRAQEKQLQLICDRPPELPKYIRSDQVKLRQVLINLLSNAVKFTQQGSITLRVTSEHLNSQVALKVSHPNASLKLHFEVEDTGIGIPSEEVHHLFEAFTQTQAGKIAQEGTGLGLVISRQFVELMGGTLSVSSCLQQGAIFRFDIWATVVEAVEPPLVRQVIGLELGQSRYRILVVDDKFTNRQLLMKLLSPLGFELREASNGQEAIAIWQEWEPHLIWMDMRMPVMDGYEATKQIKSTTQGQATAIIALTASALEEQKAIVLSAGCDDFIRKPFQDADIFETMQKHIGVRYVYTTSNQDDLLNTEEQTILSHAQVLEQLRSLPTLLINDLTQALYNVDLESLLILVEQIRTTHDALASTLQRQINNFEYEQILAAIQAVEPTVKGTPSS